MAIKSTYKPSLKETLLGIGIILLLVVIAVGVYWKQSQYDKEKYNITTAQNSAPVESIGSPSPTPMAVTTTMMPEGFQVMGEKEVLDENTLSDKIDGKADLYLDCGFKKLECQRYVSAKNPKDWYEVYVYDMGIPRNAFAVYSNQIRAGGKDISIAPFGYKTENSIFLIHGKYYLEIIGNQSNRLLQDALLAAGKNFIAENKGEALNLPEATYFPKENMVKNTYKVYLKNGFSLDKLNQVVVVNYNISGTTTMAFVAIQNTPEEAQKLAKTYYDFLIGLGSDNLDPGETSIPGLKMVDLLGDTEMIFAEGRMLAGVHQAKNKAIGRKLAESLYQTINKVEHGSNSK